jgi:putative ABC transport system permease protein
MIRHVTRLIWNRRRSHALLLLELSGSFLALALVFTLGVHYAANWGRSLGFDWEPVWVVHVDMGPESRTTAAPRLWRVLDEARSFPGVESAALASPTPYSQSERNRIVEHEGRNLEHRVATASDDLAGVLGLRLLRGRFFSREDDGAAWQAVVIDETLARAFFGDADPIGRNVAELRDRKGQPVRERRVVGVVADYRQEGEFDAARLGYAFERFSRAAAVGEEDWLPRRLALRVGPGAGAELQARLVEALQRVAPEWTFRLEPLSEARHFTLRFRLAPVLVVGLVVAFLATMVALGLSGVLWLEVTRRTREIGLRRALGADASSVRRQVLIEILVLATLAISPCLGLLVQLPWLGVLGPVTPGQFAASLALSACALYLLAVLCGYQPARLATQVAPAEALRSE